MCIRDRAKDKLVMFFIFCEESYTTLLPIIHDLVTCMKVIQIHHKLFNFISHDLENIIHSHPYPTTDLQVSGENTERIPLFKIIRVYITEYLDVRKKSSAVLN